MIRNKPLIQQGRPTYQLQTPTLPLCHGADMAVHHKCPPAVRSGVSIPRPQSPTKCFTWESRRSLPIQPPNPTEEGNPYGGGKSLRREEMLNPISAETRQDRPSYVISSSFNLRHETPRNKKKGKNDITTGRGIIIFSPVTNACLHPTGQGRSFSMQASS